MPQMFDWIFFAIVLLPTAFVVWDWQRGGHAALGRGLHSPMNTGHAPMRSAPEPVATPATETMGRAPMGTQTMGSGMSSQTMGMRTQTMGEQAAMGAARPDRAAVETAPPASDLHRVSPERAVAAAGSPPPV